MGRVLIGTSGFSYQDWRGRFYPPRLPEREWLTFYAQHFETVEINNSFYTSVKPETYRRWRAQTPAGFQFAVKGHRYITQVRRLREVAGAVERFFQPLGALGDQLAAVLWQFPPYFRCATPETLARLAEFLQLLPPSCRQALEFRHASWFTAEVQALVDRHRASLVIADSPNLPAPPFLSPHFVYVRFHGPGALYASEYSERDLEAWSQRISEWRRSRDVYCYFNNDVGAAAVRNAQLLRRLLDSQQAPSSR